jgi:hypothetical protein
MDFLDYLLYDTYSNHVTASESFTITNGYIRISQHLQNPLTDAGHWNQNERVSMSHNSLNSGDNIPKTAWEV